MWCWVYSEFWHLQSFSEWDATSDHTQRTNTIYTHTYVHVFFCFYVPQWKYNEVTGSLRTAHSNTISNSERLTCVSHYAALFLVLAWRVINAQVPWACVRAAVIDAVCSLHLRDLTAGCNCFSEAVSLHQHSKKRREKHQTTEGNLI